MIGAVVLAAGASSRMGAPKAALATPGGPTFLEAILATLHQNVALAKRMLRTVVPRLGAAVSTCSCQQALQTAIVTAPDRISAASRKKLSLFLDRLALPKKGKR